MTRASTLVLDTPGAPCAPGLEPEGTDTVGTLDAGGIGPSTRAAQW